MRPEIPLRPPTSPVTAMIDDCPTTGSFDCGYCSGELCAVHGYQPCDCDVLERHKGLEAQNTPETAHKPHGDDLGLDPT